MNERFKLLLFAIDPSFVRQATAAGVDGIIVDWENIGKSVRQRAADTEINYNTVEDLCRVRKATNGRVICRINRYGETTREEIFQAIGAGADEILLPMVSACWQVEEVLDQAAGECDVGILIETLEAVDSAKELSRLPICRAYVGLNDLAIQRGTANIFAALSDNLVQEVRRSVKVPFGFGGLTLPERGYPIPCRLLIGEMARLGCQFSFLRRSFHRDVGGCNLTDEIERIRTAVEVAAGRTHEVVARDRRELEAAIDACTANTALNASVNRWPV